MEAGLGEPGRTVTAVLAVLLTMGTMNTYVAAAVQLAGALAREGAAAARSAARGSRSALLGAHQRGAARAARRRTCSARRT